MTTLPPARAVSTSAYLDEAAERLSDLCTACGACFTACPMAAHIGLGGASPGNVTDGLRRLARGEAASAETLSWVGACARSGLCIPACPEHAKGLDAMLLVRIAKQRAMSVTGQLQAKHDPAAFPRVKTFARLQLTDEELEKWL